MGLTPLSYKNYNLNKNNMLENLSSIFSRMLLAICVMQVISEITSLLQLHATFASSSAVFSPCASDTPCRHCSCASPE